MPSFDQRPDAPRPFGFKISWFAVKASDPTSVLDALEFSETAPTNWASGLAAAYGDPQNSDSWVFASPPVGGWILMAGSSLPYPTHETHHDIGRRFDELFYRLMNWFDDVHFFGSHRVVEFAAWARALKGQRPRIFAYLGEIGEVLANVGEQTSEEAKLGFANLSGLSPSDATNKLFATAEEQAVEESGLVASGLSPREARTRIRQKGRHAFPKETDVTELAALWSIDPSRLSDQDHPLGLGLAARLPEDLAQ